PCSMPRETASGSAFGGELASAGPTAQFARSKASTHCRPVRPRRSGATQMSLSLTLAQQEIREAILKICSRFGDDYWLERDREGGFPHDFHQALAEAGWLGIAMPEAYGGSGLGITEAAVMMQAVAESGAAFSGA